MRGNIINNQNIIDNSREIDNVTVSDDGRIQLDSVHRNHLSNQDLLLTLQNYIRNGIADALESNPDLRNGERFAVELGPTLIISSLRVEYLPDNE